MSKDVQTDEDLGVNRRDASHAEEMLRGKSLGVFRASAVSLRLPPLPNAPAILRPRKNALGFVALPSLLCSLFTRVSAAGQPVSEAPEPD